MLRCSFLDTSALVDFVVRLSGIPSGTRPHSHMLPSDARSAALNLPEMAQFSWHFVCILRDTFLLSCPDAESTQVIKIENTPGALILDKILYQGLQKKILHTRGLVLKIRAFFVWMCVWILM